MALDFVQCVLWAFVGVLITWGIFFAYVGFRSRARVSRVAKASANSALLVGILWIILWVGAVVTNVLQIVGAVPSDH